MRVLLVEDEKILRVSLARELARAKHVVEACDRGAAALAFLQDREFDVVVSDIRLPGMTGFELLESIQRANPKVAVVFMTAYATVGDAVRAMRLGAYDYLTKPFEVGDLLSLLDRIHEVRSPSDETAQLRKQVERLAQEDDLGSTPAMQAILAQLPLLAGSDETILVTGETGTGKEHFARLVHARSARAKGPFIQLSCAALSRELIESELFGHERGSFTGASERTIGRFERAQHGTLLLDEVDDIPLDLQVKLLQVLQSSEIERVGGQKPLRLDVRVIAATKIDLAAAVRDTKRFREDLYYRLNVLPVVLPPLRERREDIPRLVQQFLAQASHPIAIAPEAMDELVTYAWPGNIRELENLVRRLVVLRGDAGEIGLEHLPLHIRQAAALARISGGAEVGPYEQHMHRCETELLLSALDRAGGNRTRAAAALGLAPSTLRDRLVKLGIVERGDGESR